MDKVVVTKSKLDGLAQHINAKAGTTGAKTIAQMQATVDGITGAEVYYIDLEGSYPDYTCPVAMADIKAAYEAGKVLICRGTIDGNGELLTATLSLINPMPSANTWIFSGAGALPSMNFPAESLTIAIVNGAVRASLTALATLDDIPEYLPNYYALTVKIGSTTVTYDGSSSQTVEIADGTEVSY